MLAPWYKGTLTDNTIPGMPKGSKVWFKRNTEKPLNSGPTFWVFDANKKVVRHIVEDIGSDLLQGVREDKGWSIATETQTTELNKRFKPLVTKIITGPSWANVGKPQPQPGAMPTPPKQQFRRP